MPLAAVVVNPTKVDDPDAVRAQITRICVEHGWSEPLWLETTADDPGSGQTREALERGADVVMAHGGDGTVRAVAEVLAGTRTPLGLLPAGTGNLLARNMDATLDDVEGSVRIALTGDDRAVDVGWMTVDDGDERAFLVMAGLRLRRRDHGQRPGGPQGQGRAGGVRGLGPGQVQRRPGAGADEGRRRRGDLAPRPHRRHRQLRQAPRRPGADARRRARRRHPRRRLDRPAGRGRLGRRRRPGADPAAARPQAGRALAAAPAAGGDGDPAGGPARRRPDRRGVPARRAGRPRCAAGAGRRPSATPRPAASATPPAAPVRTPRRRVRSARTRPTAG